MSDWYQIESNQIIVQIVSKGAELKRLFNKIWNKEMLWPGDEKIWNRSAPVLFPIIGELKDGEYIFNGNIFKLPRHGFARDLEFVCNKCTGDELEFTLVTTKEIYKIYPFVFEFKINYFVKDSELIIKYSVKNLDNKEMLFSLGFHPGFDLDSGSEYEIKFERIEDEFIGLTNNLIDTRKSKKFKSDLLELNPKLFFDDALIIPNLKSNYLDLHDKKHNKTIRIKYSKASYLGIWSKENMPFVCIEPWNGVADYVNHDKDFNHKIGLIKLASDQIFQNEISIELIG